MVYLEEEWTRRSKEEWYWASIRCELMRIQQMFAKNPKQISIEDALLPFEVESQSPNVRKSVPTSPGQVEIGSQAAREGRWAQVNSNAKSVWAARFGKRKLDE